MLFEKTRRKLAAKMIQFLNRTLDPADYLAGIGSSGPILSRCLFCAVELRVADALADDTVQIGELASRVGADADALERLLKTLSVVGVFRREKKGGFRNNAHSNLLRSRSTSSLSEWVSYVGASWQWAHWNELPQTIRSGGSDRKGLLFQWVENNPQLRTQFNAAMESRSRSADQAILAKIDLGRYRHLVDLGGGSGHFLREALQRYPRLRGTLFDIPPTIESLSRGKAFADMGDRVQLVGGDFLQVVPQDGDVYLLRHVLHNWSDEDVLQILKNCRKAVPPQARLFIVDMLVQENSLAPRCMDIAMLHLLGGKERTPKEFKALLAQAGFRLSKIETTRTPLSVLTAKPLSPRRRSARTALSPANLPAC